MWSRGIKHTKRWKTKRTWCCRLGLGSFVQRENSWYRTSAAGEGRVYQAQLFWLKALSRSANDGRTAYNKKVNCNAMYLNSTKWRKRTKRQRSSIWVYRIRLSLRRHGVGIFSIPKFSMRLALPIQTCNCNYILSVKSVEGFCLHEVGYVRCQLPAL